MTSQEHGADMFLRFVETMRPTDRPDMIYLTGGEALLRPELVRQITLRAHEVGTRIALLSGMFFARQPSVPRPIAQAIALVDHFAASMDVFHESQVPRAEVFRVMHELLDAGKDLSFQVTGIDEDDPYLADVTSAIRKAFDDRIPILVAKLGAIGRAKDWYAEQPGDNAHRPLVAYDPDPCAMATWPTVSWDGSILACCNQDAVDGSAPPHLRLGHASTDAWSAVRTRLLTSPLLRAVRVYGPLYVAQRFGSAQTSCDGYCKTCFKLSDDPMISERLTPLMASPGMAVVDEQVALMQQDSLARRYGVGRYAELITLGSKREPAAQKEAALWAHL
jgi:hypothetical protein